MLLAGLLLSIAGGVFSGIYPVPIKAPSVVKAEVHPIVFQCYKTTWVFVTGWLLVAARAAIGKEPVFEFNYWGAVSAAAWIPAGLFTILSVPRIGVGPAMVINAGTNAVWAFVAGWLLLGDTMRERDGPAGHYYLAPLWLACTVSGIVVLILVQRTRPAAAEAPRVADGAESDSASEPERGPESDQEEAALAPAKPHEEGVTDPARLVVGYICALLAGAFSTAQTVIIEAAEHFERNRHHCRHHKDDCPPALKERFNSFGSWFASFGVGAAGVTLLFVAALFAAQRARGRAMPPFHPRIFAGPGSVAGVCWCLGNIGGTGGVMLNGNATSVPTCLSFSIVTSGAFGVLYYRELSGRRALVWSAAAAWTLSAVLLLSFERT